MFGNIFDSEFDNEQNTVNFSFKDLFYPLTTKKAIVIISIVGFIVYFNMLFNGFVWDDLSFILNPTYGHTLNIAVLFGPNSFNSYSYYRPIPALYFALLYAVAGPYAFLYHFFQILLHVIDTVLVFFLFRSFLRSHKTKDKSDEQTHFQSLSGSQRVRYLREYGHPVKMAKTVDTSAVKIDILCLFLSLIFLVHPINVESVSYIAASQSELFFLFGIIALLISMKKKTHFKDLFFVSGFTLLSLLTKETGFLFLLMILFFQFLFYQKRLFKFSLFELISLAVYFYLRFEIGTVFFTKFNFDAPVPIANLPLLERLVNSPAIALYYLQTFFFPLQLAIKQNWVIPVLTFHDFYLPLLIEGAFLLVVYLAGIHIYRYSRDHFKIYIFFFLWFLTGIGVILQIFPLELTVADRWFYFPIVGLLGMLGVWVNVAILSSNNLSESLVKYKTAEKVTICLTITLILLLSIRTFVRNANYFNDITLNTHDAQTQNNFVLESDIGDELGNQGNSQAAYPHLQKSVRLHPYVTNLMELGVYYDLAGNAPEAQKYYYKALNSAKTASTDGYSDLNVLLTYVKLANSLLRSKDYIAAANESKMGIKQYPHSDGTSILLQDLAISNHIINNPITASTSAEK